jgi:hypothetical protein
MSKVIKKSPTRTLSGAGISAPSRGCLANIEFAPPPLFKTSEFFKREFFRANSFQAIPLGNKKQQTGGSL